MAVVSMRSSWYETVKENLAARLLTRCSRFQTLPIVYFMPDGSGAWNPALPASTVSCRRGKMVKKDFVFSSITLRFSSGRPHKSPSPKVIPSSRHNSIHALVLIRIFLLLLILLLQTILHNPMFIFTPPERHSRNYVNNNLQLAAHNTNFSLGQGHQVRPRKRTLAPVECIIFRCDLPLLFNLPANAKLTATVTTMMMFAAVQG